ncbi:hypothetical protein GBAR_LOCUS11922, partial [Geodia barretti]
MYRLYMVMNFQSSPHMNFYCVQAHFVLQEKAVCDH